MTFLEKLYTPRWAGPPRMLLNLGDGQFAEAAEATGTAIPPSPTA